MTGPAAGRGLLVGGTTSDAGKTVLVTGLCRVAARRGIAVAPFKAQNMSNNTVVVADPDGRPVEIGRAQWVQARAARVAPSSAMNPVLLQPATDRTSHVLVRGRAAGRLRAGEFAAGRAHLAAAAFDALGELRAAHDLVICEGAGSIAEINLRARDYVNLGLARHGRLPTIVVGDIDRGGVFAAMFGALALLEPADQALVTGFVVNNFRGDPELLRPGTDALAARTGRAVYGVLPHAPGLWLDSEDSLSALCVPDDTAAAADPLTVAVIAYPRAAQVTDLDGLALEPRVRLRPVRSPRELVGADAVILPGSRATVSDLAWLRARGLDGAITAYAETGGTVLGIGGGHQMLGTCIRDRDGAEAPAGTDVAGLGLIGAVTDYAEDRVLAVADGSGGVPAGAFRAAHGRTSGSATDLSVPVTGTDWHGIFDDRDTRAAWLTAVAARAGAPTTGLGAADLQAAREARIDRIADLIEEHLDVDRILVAAEQIPAVPTLRTELA